MSSEGKLRWRFNQVLAKNISTKLNFQKAINSHSFYIFCAFKKLYLKIPFFNKNNKIYEILYSKQRKF